MKSPYHKVTETVFRIGSAHRLLDGTVKHYNLGNTEYPTLEKAQAYIDGLYDSYRSRDIALPCDEFVPVEISTTEYRPVPF